MRLETTPGSPPAVTVLPSGADKGKKPEQAAFTQLQLGGDTYVVPNVAIPYLSTIDIRLFNLSYLARAGLDDEHSATLPVSVTYSRPTATTLPGVTATAPAGGKASAGIDKGQASQLGELLTTQWQRAEKSGAPAGKLDGIARIELARSGAEKLPVAPAMLGSAPASGEAAGPAYRTLTLNPITRNGEPGHAIGFVQNVDDLGLSPNGVELGFVLVGDGYPNTFSVPTGTYSITTTVVDGPIGDYSVPSAFVAEPEVSVTADTTVDLDARKAVPFETTLEAPLETPEYRQDMMTFTRTSERGGDRRVQATNGSLLSMIFMRMWSFPGDDFNDNDVLSATPTRPVTKGSFDFAGLTQYAQDPTDTAAPMRPSYRLAFPTEGRIPDSLTNSVGQSDLTTVRTTIYSDKPVPNHFVDLYLPWSVHTLGVEAPVVHPGEHVDHWYSSAPELTLWQEAVTREEATDPEPRYIRIYGPRRSVRPGEQISQEWHKGPLVPSPIAPYLYENGFSISLVGGNPTDLPMDSPTATVCTACRQDNNGMVYIRPFSDSDPRHASRTAEDRTSALSFYRNGKLAINRAAAAPGHTYVAPDGLALPLLAEAATYRLDWTSTEHRDPAISTTTRWTFRSGGDDPAADLPKDMFCGPDTSRDCSLLPLLFLNYDLDLTPALTAPAGSPFEVALRVSAQQAAPAPTGVSATVSVSYDDGATWTDPRPATGRADGTFALPVQHPPLGETSGFVSLRVNARDAAGNSVEQELIHAYALHG
ncbi:hypothetical protein BLA60_22115 [Actinophytocola xinjiangensis]|uniref:Uncharacterized protein n=1 Tax=Actinophytocola xinjiangensis TaxID=485602 RepID=A0A7Z1AX49_9PSEU|nr:hypothetical protein BLA60_22115 [Actinophytocola xinjiangensis]